MALGMPSIEITFKQLAATAIRRSSRGVLALVIRDEAESVKTYITSLEIEEGFYTSENTEFITQAFLGAPAKVIVVALTADTASNILKKTLDALSFNWVTFASAAEADQEMIVAYVKNRNSTKAGKKVKGFVYNVTVTNDMHIVNFTTPKATLKKGNTEVDGWRLLPRLAGVLAGLPMTRSATYYTMDDIISVTEPEDLDAAVDNGNFFLFNDEGEIRIARAVNSMKDLGVNQTEDMKSIAIVEAMNLIEEDIYTTFKKDYLGKYKNDYDNQCLFIAAVNGYFKDLTKEQILDKKYKNIAGVDVEAQRDAWLANGTEEAKEWDEEKVKNMSFKRKVFLTGDIKVLDAMEDMKFPITMA